METILSASKTDKYLKRSLTSLTDNWLEYSDGDEFLVGIDLTIHSAQFKIDDMDIHLEMDEMINEDKAQKICQLSGYLILAEEAEKANYDPLIVCDNYDGDLSYTYSILSEYGLEFDKKMGQRNNVLYIHEIIWDKNVDVFTRKRAVSYIKGFIFELYNIRVDIISYYLAPTSPYHRDSYLTKEKEQMMIDKLSTLFNDNDSQETNIVQMSDYIDFSEGINEQYNDDDSDPEYPEELINWDEYNGFSEIGFTELGESRLMIRVLV